MCHLQAFVGDIFCREFGVAIIIIHFATEIAFEDGEITCNDHTINDFSAFIKRINYSQYLSITNEHVNHIETMGCSSLKEINFGMNRQLSTGIQFKTIESKLNQIEILTLGCYQIGNVYDTILKYCPNVVKMTIKPFWEDNRWLYCIFPKLIHIHIVSSNIMIECKEFLQQNATIKILSCSLEFLYSNRDWLRTTNTKLEYLEIDGMHTHRLEQTRTLIQELHKRESFQKLRLDITLEI